MLGANGLSVPLSPNEGSLSASWNMPVPGALIQPNLTILAEVDPANTVAETNESDNHFPSSGTPLALDVRPTTTFAVRFVPILQTVNGLQGDVTNANKASYLAAAMRMHPLAAYRRRPARAAHHRRPRRAGQQRYRLDPDPERAQGGAHERRQLAILLRRRQADLLERHRRHRLRRAAGGGRLGQVRGGPGRRARVGPQLGPAARALRQRRQPGPQLSLRQRRHRRLRLRRGGADHQAAYVLGSHGVLQQRVDQRLHLHRRAGLPRHPRRRRERLRPGHAAVPAGLGTHRRRPAGARAGLPGGHPPVAAGGAGPVQRRGPGGGRLVGLPRQLHARPGGR